MEALVITHVFSSLFMTGLCWFVQLVHYPLFRAIPLEHFAQYERKNFATGFITIPVMVVELLTGLILTYHSPSMLYFINVALMGVIGLSTVIFQVPLHLKLRNAPSVDLINRLIHTNWIRTIGWSVRVVLLGVIVFEVIGGGRQ